MKPTNAITLDYKPSQTTEHRTRSTKPTHENPSFETKLSHFRIYTLQPIAQRSLHTRLLREA
jgi:hypothetical protein